MSEHTTADLFGLEPLPPSRHDNAYSKAAARTVAPKARSIRAGALEVLRDPVTDDEGARRLGVSGNTWRPARGELVRRGLVVRVATGKSDAGNAAAVWQAVEHVGRDRAEGVAGDLLVQVLDRRPTWMGKAQLSRLIREALDTHKGNSAAALRQVVADLEQLR